MLKELYTAANGMHTHQTRLEVIANNIANASTVGFKRDSVFERNLIDSKANLFNITGHSEQNDPPVGSYIDFTKGASKRTDNRLDIAIDGDAFFTVRDEEGKEYLTRAGNFLLNMEGEVITQSGKYLLADSGTINLFQQFNNDSQIGDKRINEFKVSENGEIFVNNQSVGSILLTRVSNPNSLEKISDTDYIVTKDTEYSAVDIFDQIVRQGWLEESNVNVIDEMVEMIMLQRMFDLGSKVIQTNDNTLEESIKQSKIF